MVRETAYARGYQQALADIAQRIRDGESVTEWVSNNLARGYHSGDRVYRWWDTGALGVSYQPLTVVRQNRQTVTVRTDQGNIFRLPLDDIAGYCAAG